MNIILNPNNSEIRKFKIFPHWKQETKEYYEVFIFDSLNSMYEYYQYTGGYAELDFLAICRDLDIYKGDIPLNKIGEILIPVSELKPQIISHECGHVVFQYIRKIHQEKMWTYLNEDKTIWKMEEMYCQILEELVKQFYQELD